VLEIETLVRDVEAIADEGARERARALVTAVLELHGAALARIAEEVRKASGEGALRELARDDSVGCVLALHGLLDPEPPPTPRVPTPPPTRPEGFVPVERLLARRPSSGESERDRCDLCSAALGDRHEHLVDPDSRELRCACGPCASLFGAHPRDGSRWKRVRPRADRLDSFCLADDSWSALGIPIELAFFFRSSRDQRVVAMYPSPAGATESLLSLDAWTRIEAENPDLCGPRGLEDDVEALLVRRGRGAHEHYRVSIDTCYALVGRIRRHWRGLGGGSEVWEQIGAFFEDLRVTSTSAARSLHA
jgi:hypothetical protein